MLASIKQSSHNYNHVSILGGKPIGLFGSYDWGDGQWMRDWVDRMKGLGAAVDGEGLITQLVPTAEVLEQCHELGKRLAGGA
jgi:flavorubredoxin